MPVSVAIVGAGPSGFYAAESLIKSKIDSQIDIIERLPTPYGLIRFGVAPDHEKTKRVTGAYERTALDDRIRYFGNVEIGTALSMDELRGLYDAVIVAVGAPLDRALAVPGGDKAGVYGAAAFVGWYNGHPDFCDLDPDLNTDSVAIIGNGNVALDVARVLAKTPAEMAATDLPAYAAEAIHGAPITDIHVIGRRGPVEAKWTNVELREMGRLKDALPVVESSQLPERIEGEMSERDRRLKDKNLATLRGFLRPRPSARTVRVHFTFFANPVEVLGDQHVEALRVERTRLQQGRAVGTGESFEIPCGLIVTSIGYQAQPLAGLPFDPQRGIVINCEGRVDHGLYVVGWAKRGPIGVIASNKPDGVAVARQIAEDIGDERKAGRSGLEKLLQERAIEWVTFSDWKSIEAAEIAAAGPSAPRRKLIRIKEMLAILQSESLSLGDSDPVG